MHWGLISVKEVEWFFKQSPDYIIFIWNGYIKRQKKDSNLHSISIAKQSLVIETGFAAIGGAADKVEQDLGRYLPFNTKVEENTHYLSNEVVRRFWKKFAAMPPYMKQALIKEKDLKERLEYLKQSL